MYRSRWDLTGKLDRAFCSHGKGFHRPWAARQRLVLRGDINFIDLGEATNVQDGSVIHLADEYPVRIGPSHHV